MQITPIPTIAGGLDFQFDPRNLPDHMWEYAQNIDFSGVDVIRKRRGVRAMGSVQGVPMLMDQFYKRDGSSWLVLITTSHVYYYNHAEEMWEDITPAGGLSGTANDIVSADIAYDTLLFTNGIDAIMQWDGTGIATPLGSTTHKAKVIRKFGERIFALHLTDDGAGNAEPQMFKFTAPGTLNDWTGPGSGTVQLSEGVDWIQTAELIGNSLAIYRERSIVLGTYVGGSMFFRWDNILSGIGTPSPRGVINLGNEHIFLGWDNVYSYTGGRSAEPMGNQIQRMLLNFQNPRYAHRSMMVILEDLNQIWCATVSTNSEWADTIWVYDYLTKRWTMNTFTVTSFGYWQTEENIRIMDAIGTFDEQTGRFDDRVYLAGAPIITMGKPNGDVVYLDGTALTDVGDPIDAHVVTKSFFAGDFSEIKRWLGCSVEARGKWLEVSYRTDGGPWVSAATLELDMDWQRYRVDFDTSGRTLQLRFRNDQPDVDGVFEVRGIDVRHIVSRQTVR